MNKLNKILLTTSGIILGLSLIPPIHASNEIQDADIEKILKTTLLFKCNFSQIIGINTQIKHSPWFMEFSVDNESRLHLIDHQKARFRHNNTRLTWIDAKSENQIQIDPLKDQEITYIKKIFDTEETIKRTCTVWIR